MGVHWRHHPTIKHFVDSCFGGCDAIDQNVASTFKAKQLLWTNNPLMKKGKINKSTE